MWTDYVVCACVCLREKKLLMLLNIHLFPYSPTILNSLPPNSFSARAEQRFSSSFSSDLSIVFNVVVSSPASPSLYFICVFHLPSSHKFYLKIKNKLNFGYRKNTPNPVMAYDSEPSTKNRKQSRQKSIVLQ